MEKLHFEGIYTQGEASAMMLVRLDSAGVAG